MKHPINYQEYEELSEQRQLAETVRAACIQAALDGYENASISGLCHEGAWECAVDAIRSLNIKAILEQMATDLKDGPSGESG